MKTSYKILLLSDLKKTAPSILKSTINLANIVNGKIDIFHVKKATDMVKTENQFSSMRSINSEFIKTKKEMQELVDIAKESNTKVTSSFAFGNVKNQINEYIKTEQPDIIVVGKPRAKILGLGDGITNFVIKNHSGSIFVISENSLEETSELSLGVLNSVEQSFDIDFADSLVKHTKEPIKSFAYSQEKNMTSTAKSNIKTVDYVFNENSEVSKNLDTYLAKNNINLFCVGSTKDKVQNVKTKNLNQIINNVNCSLLIQNNINYESTY